jgi:hypothetical protein
MKKIYLTLILILSVLSLIFESCGSIVVTSRLGTPPPPWFYPNRVETIRYVYFPDFEFYYDLSLRNYIYLDNGVWITASILPSRFKEYNLKRSRKVRINDYYGDNIRKYHNETTSKRKSLRSKRYY